MRPVFNSKVTIQPDMYIKLLHGDTVFIGDRAMYAWNHSEKVFKVDGTVIWFYGYPTTDWFTTDMEWEIEEGGTEE